MSCRMTIESCQNRTYSSSTVWVNCKKLSRNQRHQYTRTSISSQESKCKCEPQHTRPNPLASSLPILQIAQQSKLTDLQQSCIRGLLSVQLQVHSRLGSAEQPGAACYCCWWSACGGAIQATTSWDYIHFSRILLLLIAWLEYFVVHVQQPSAGIIIIVYTFLQYRERTAVVLFDCFSVYSG